MKKFIVALLVIVFAAVLVVGGVVLYSHFFSEPGSKVNPTWAKEASNPYVSTLNDKDGVRQSSKNIGISVVGAGESIPLDKVEEVVKCKNYDVQSSYSHHYLVPKAKSLLDEIGEEFHRRCKEAGIRKAKFIVTSLLRTQDDNTRLSKKNGNVSQNSLHRNGTTFDITYKDYRCSSSEAARTCDRILGEILTEFRAQGKCWVLVENQQTCFHITVRPEYGE